jgi:hypothetical protein
MVPHTEKPRLEPGLRQEAKRALREQMLGVGPAAPASGHPEDTL